MAQNTLLDILQGASNAAASTVTAPVDGLTWLLRKAGVPVPTPVGGSDWMAQRGLLAQPQNKMAGLLGEALGVSAPIVVAAKAPQIAGHLNLLLRGQPSKIEASASRSVGRDPPSLPQRSFEHDYPTLPAGSVGGQRLSVDIEGRPLGGGAIAGRRLVGGPDVPLNDAELASVLRQLNIPVTKRTVGELGRKVDGKYYSAGGERSIGLLDSLDAARSGRTVRHEFGHALDDLSGPYSPALRGGALPDDGIKRSLASLYDDLNSPMGPAAVPRPPKKQVTPGYFGYRPEQFREEHLADAFRAYLTDPNYIKAKWPDVAAHLRKFVNTSPLLKDIVQLNSAASGALLLPALSEEGDGLQ